MRRKAMRFTAVALTQGRSVCETETRGKQCITGGITRNVQEAAAGVTEVTTNIIGVNESVSQVSEISGEVLSVSNELASHAETLSQVLNS